MLLVARLGCRSVRVQRGLVLGERSCTTTARDTTRDTMRDTMRSTVRQAWVRARVSELVCGVVAHGGPPHGE